MSFRPFAARGRRAVIAIMLTFAVSSAVSMTVSIVTTSRSKHQAAVVEVAARQRTLVDRYIKEVLLERSGVDVDPSVTGKLLTQSAAVLVDGGEVPAVAGDDDDAQLTPAKGTEVRGQLAQERRLAADLTATGGALLAGRQASAVRLTAHEHVRVDDPIARLRIIGALASNVSLNTVRTLATATDHNITDLITLQAALGAAGLLTSLLLAFALIATTRRQSAHFRSLVTSSTDLVLVYGPDGCRYASKSVADMLGAPEAQLLGDGLDRFVAPDDLGHLRAARTRGEPRELVVRVKNRFGEWRHVEAHVTDLRTERHVRGVVLNARDITERVRLEEALTQQAFHDALTGLANRALLRDRLDQFLARSERSGDMLAVLLIDLDGFKQVNDTLGHDAGDRLLEIVAQRLTAITRPSDTVARLGGDEFVLLLDGADRPLAEALAARMLEHLREPVSIAGRELSVSASIGIVMHGGGAGESADLLRHADLAMYAAKEAGRGRYELFHLDMARDVGEMLGLEHELRLGLQRGEFTMHYQPEIAVGTSEIVGVEALMRWNSPTRGAVPPTRFIPVAEATGLILPIGELALRESCAQAARWRAEGVLPTEFTMWVNVSGKQLSAGGLEALVCEVLDAEGLPPTVLGIEVTETAIVEEGLAGERARAELESLRSLGVKVAIDDFGTGFSSLGQLRRLPVDMIKVDRSFVEGVEHNSRDAAITSNLVSLAHSLGLVATAEGIESAGQLASLRKLGCDVAQGYLFARPMPPEALGELLASASRRDAA